jgi:hypothetical protein
MYAEYSNGLLENLNKKKKLEGSKKQMKGK